MPDRMNFVHKVQPGDVRAEMKWRPIESAPRDGTPFLASDPARDTKAVCRMENISTKDPNWVCRAIYWDWSEDHPVFTRWVPLPRGGD